MSDGDGDTMDLPGFNGPARLHGRDNGSVYNAWTTSRVVYNSGFFFARNTAATSRGFLSAHLHWLRQDIWDQDAFVRRRQHARGSGEPWQASADRRAGTRTHGASVDATAAMAWLALCDGELPLCDAASKHHPL